MKAFIAVIALSALFAFAVAADAKCSDQNSCKSCLEYVEQHGNETQACSWCQDDEGRGSCHHANSTCDNHETTVGNINQCPCTDFGNDCAGCYDNTNGCAYCFSTETCVNNSTKNETSCHDWAQFNTAAGVEQCKTHTAVLPEWVIILIIALAALFCCLFIVVPILICCCCGAAFVACCCGGAAAASSTHHYKPIHGHDEHH